MFIHILRVVRLHCLFPTFLQEIDAMDTASNSPVFDGDDKKQPEEESIDGKPIDGKPIDGKPIDGKPIDEKHIDGKPIDEKHIDGKPISSGEVPTETEMQGEGDGVVAETEYAQSSELTGE